MRGGFGDFVGGGGQGLFTPGSVEDDPRAAAVVDDQPDREVAVRQGGQQVLDAVDRLHCGGRAVDR